MRYNRKWLLLLCGVIFYSLGCAQPPRNWTEEQLMQPGQLAGEIKSGESNYTIISVGPSDPVPGSISAGMTGEKKGLDNLTQILSGMNRKSNIVIYCGCCPFDHCPNVRPAINLLKEMNFTNYYLLNLPQNIRADWINKGYPVKKS